MHRLISLALASLILAPAAMAAPAAAGYKTEAEAHHACGTQAVVWANTNTKVYHRAGDRYFGKTKHGTFLCQNIAQQDGFRLAGTDKGAPATTQQKH